MKIATTFEVAFTIHPGRHDDRPGKRVLRGLASIADCQRAYAKIRDNSDAGGSSFGEGLITEAGQTVARISYNGRVWEPIPYPEAKLIAEFPSEFDLVLEAN